MHSLIYHIVKHLLRGLVIVIRHLIHHAPAAHTAVRHAATAHTAVRHAAAAQTVGASTLGAARAGLVPPSSTAAALHGFNQQSNIMASVGQDQAAAIPDVGDFS